MLSPLFKLFRSLSVSLYFLSLSLEHPYLLPHPRQWSPLPLYCIMYKYISCYPPLISKAESRENTLYVEYVVLPRILTVLACLAVQCRHLFIYLPSVAFQCPKLLNEIWFISKINQE